MRVRHVVMAVCVLVCHAAAAAPTKLFDVTLEDSQGVDLVLIVRFYGKLPPPASVDTILRQSLEHAVLVESSKTIKAYPFRGDDNADDGLEGGDQAYPLTRNQFSGQLIYDSRTKKIVTLNEYEGIKTSITAASGYTVQVEEHKRRLVVTLVFPNQPAQDAAYAALIAEAEKLAARRLDMDLYVSVGDPKAKWSWQQMYDKNTAYVFAEYSATSKKLTRQGRLLKQL